MGEDIWNIYPKKEIYIYIIYICTTNQYIYSIYIYICYKSVKDPCSKINKILELTFCKK